MSEASPITDTMQIIPVDVSENTLSASNDHQQQKQVSNNSPIQFNKTMDTIMDDLHTPINTAKHINDDTNDAKIMTTTTNDFVLDNDAKSIETTDIQPSASPEPFLLEPVSGNDSIAGSDEDIRVHNQTNNNTNGNPFSGKPELTDAENVMIGKRNYLYRLIDSQTELYWHVDAEINKQSKQMFVGSVEHHHHFANTGLNNRAQRQRVVNGSKHSDSDRALKNTPDSVGTGYGELSAGSMDKLFKWLCTEAPEDFQLNKDSIFLDIGSGFGKAVFHAALRANCQRSYGIEYVEARHEKAKQCKAYLTARHCPSIHHSTIPDEYTDIDVSHCLLRQGDACDNKFLDIINSATHIYMFDWVFKEETHKKLLPIIDKSNFKLFISYQSQRITKLKLTNFIPIHSMKCMTTGKQSFQATFYVRSNAQHAINTRSVRRSVSRLINEQPIDSYYSDQDTHTTQHKHSNNKSHNKSNTPDTTDTDEVIDEPVSAPPNKRKRKSTPATTKTETVDERISKSISRKLSQQTIVEASDFELPTESTQPKSRQSMNSSDNKEDVYMQRMMAAIAKREEKERKRLQKLELDTTNQSNNTIVHTPIDTNGVPQVRSETVQTSAMSNENTVMSGPDE